MRKFKPKAITKRINVTEFTARVVDLQKDTISREPMTFIGGDKYPDYVIISEIERATGKVIASIENRKEIYYKCAMAAFDFFTNSIKLSKEEKQK